MSNQFALVSLLRTYLGEEVADHIHSGQFKRGDGTFIDAVIWFCDLRNFTSFVDQHPPELFFQRPNSYFDAVGEAIDENGGEILKFMGDGILAVHPIDSSSDGGEVANQALAAARMA